MITFQSKIRGIPCLIHVTHHYVQKPLGPRCDSDWDARGYTELEFEVLDRRGRYAKWLERKMKPEDVDRIETEAEAHLEQNRQDDFDPPDPSDW